MAASVSIISSGFTGLTYFDPQRPLESLPDPLLHQIMVHCDYNSCLKMAELSKRMHLIATHPDVWKEVFRLHFSGCTHPTETVRYQSQDYPDFRRQIGRLRQLKANILHDRYTVSVLKNYPKDTCSFFTVQNLICFAQSGGTLQIYNIESDQLECKLESAEVEGPLEQLKTLLKNYLRIIKNYESGVSDASSTMEKIQQFLEKLNEFLKEEHLHAFVTLRALISNISPQETALLQLFEKLKPIFKNVMSLLEHNYGFNGKKSARVIRENKVCIQDIETDATYVSAFAVSDHYLAFAYSSGYVEIWDRAASKKNASILVHENPATSLEFDGEKLYICIAAARTFKVYHLKTNELQTFSNIRCHTIKRFDRKKLLLLDSDFLYVFDLKDLTSVVPIFLIHQALYFVANPENQNQIGILLQSDDGYRFQIREYDPQQSCYFLRRELSLTTCYSIQWRHDFLWLDIDGQNENFIKINLNDESKQDAEKIELASKPLSHAFLYYTYSRRYQVWSKERLMIYMPKVGMLCFNFLATSKEVLQNIAQEYEMHRWHPSLARVEKICDRDRVSVLTRLDEILPSGVKSEKDFALRPIWAADWSSTIKAVREYLNNYSIIKKKAHHK